MTKIQIPGIINETFIGLSTNPQGFSAYTTQLRTDGYIVRTVRGQKCRNHANLLDEFSAALQFPWYFGENWPAFNECIRDLDWLSLSTERVDFGLGLVIAVRRSAELLRDMPADRLAELVDVLKGAAQEFGTTVNSGNWWDHGPITFKVILHGETPENFDRWSSAGADIQLASPGHTADA